MVDSVKTLVVLCIYMLYWFNNLTLGRLNREWFVLWTRVKDGYHAQIHIVLFNPVHPEDGRRRRPKHVSVVGTQRV
jgi:hypothetical protein